jgi:hypothetical protein
MGITENLWYKTVLFNGHSAYQGIPSQNYTILLNHTKNSVEMSPTCFNKAQFDIISHSFLVFQVVIGEF